MDYEELGLIADRVDSLAHGLVLPFPPQIHVDQLKRILPEIRDALRAIVVRETGENPWASSKP